MEGLEAEALGDGRHISGREIYGEELAFAVQGLEGLDPAKATVIEINQNGRDI